jgi:hypothetical protein
MKKRIYKMRTFFYATKQFGGIATELRWLHALTGFY